MGKKTLSEFLISFVNSHKVIFLSGLVTGFILLSVSSQLFRLNDDVTYGNLEKSPDGKYVAIVYTVAGGGAAGYCYTYVSVTPINRFSSFQLAEYSVAGGRCTSDTNLEWDSDDILLIRNIGSPYIQKTENSDKKVRIEYQ